MPTCPGCEQSISHGRLDVHQRYCRDIWGDAPEGARALERLDRRMEAIERRLDRRVRDLETDLDRELAETGTARSSEAARRR